MMIFYHGYGTNRKRKRVKRPRYTFLGRRNDAEAVLRRTEAESGELRLLSEQADGRSGARLPSNDILHAEYVRAVLHLYDLWPRGWAGI
jgi:GH15 family glucan-1,4-alpha-glucosidase